MSLTDLPAPAKLGGKRARILDVACELFLEKGYSGASMSQLLHLVGGSKTTIYTYFGDKARLFTAIVDELLKDTVVFSDSFNPGELKAADAIFQIAEQHLKVVLSERYIRLARVVLAEVNQFPELGKAFYEHGPGRSYQNFQTFLEQRVVLGELHIESISRATDLFFGTLLHREVLMRLYGVSSPGLKNRKSVAQKVADEFVAHYGVGI